MQPPLTDTQPNISLPRAEAFRRAYPAYADTAVLDRLRASDFGHLDATSNVKTRSTSGERGPGGPGAGPRSSGSSPARMRSICPPATDSTSAVVRPTWNAQRIATTDAAAGVPNGASLPSRIRPGGTSEKSARWSAGFHHAVSKKRLGWSSSRRQIQARSVTPTCARMSGASGNLSPSTSASRPREGSRDRNGSSPAACAPPPQPAAPQRPDAANQTAPHADAASHHEHQRQSSARAPPQAPRKGSDGRTEQADHLMPPRRRARHHSPLDSHPAPSAGRPPPVPRPRQARP